MIDLENTMILEFSLDKQTLKRADDFHPVEKSEVYLQMHFTFDKDWDNTKRHVFFQYRNEKVYEQILTSDSCYVPIEVIKKYGFYVWLIGYDIATGEVKIPTNQLRVNVYEGSEEETGETTYINEIISNTLSLTKSGNVYKAEIPNKYVTGIRYDEKTGIIEFLGRTENGIEKVISVIDLPIDEGTLGYDDTEIKKAIEKLQKEKANASEVLDENEIKSLIDENVPKKTSQLENDNQFINRVVDDLVNYYKKTETYTKTEINNLISAIPKFNILVVESLPTSDISLTTVYLLKENEDGGNLYTEYIYANGSWEILGSQKIDLTGYATEKWVEGKGYLTEHQDISGKAEKTVVEEIDKRLSTAEKELENKVEIVEGKELSSNDFTDQLLNKLDGIEAGANKYVLPTDVVKDSNYVHTDNNFTTLEKNKLSNLKNYDDTIVQERLDKAEEELEKKQTKLTAGENITILEDGTISANITAEDVGIQVDKTLDSKSENPIANKPVYEAINALNTNKADKNITINSKPLSENIDLSKSDIGLGNVINTGDSAIPLNGGTEKFTTGGAFTELGKKVDKVSGYGLSKNDLTDELLAKLNSLNNYDDTEIQKKIKAIEEILKSDDIDLDTLQELVTSLKNNTSSINDIFNALSNKQDKLTFDTTPTANSNNPVTSSGIKSALDLKVDKTEFEKLEIDAIVDVSSINEIQDYTNEQVFYRVVSGGTVVPNTGYVEKVYFNTALSVEEVVSILSQLTYNAGYREYLLVTNEGDEYVTLYCQYKNNIYSIHSRMKKNGVSETNVLFTSTDNNNGFTGWNPNITYPIIVNDTAEPIDTEEGISQGTQNDKLINLISTTPFGNGEIKLYHVKNNEIFEVDKEVTKETLGLGNVNNVSITAEQVAQIQTNKENIDTKQSIVKKLGGLTKPVYVSANGTFSETSPYAGGSKITLNDNDVGGKEASFYAPTKAGTAGDILVSKGSGVPSWIPQGNLTTGKAVADQQGNIIDETYATKDEVKNLPTKDTDTWRPIYVDGTQKLGEESGEDKLLNIKSGDNITLTVTEDENGNSNNLEISAKDTTYEEATTSESGLMSATDKSNLDSLEKIFENYDTDKTINESLEEKQNKLTFDEKPTKDSTNPVTSGGIYSEYNGAKNVTNIIAKNIDGAGNIKAKFDIDGKEITDEYLHKTGGEISGTLKQTAGNLGAYGDLSYHDEYITFTSNARSDNVNIKFKDGSRNGNNTEEVAFVTDLPSVATTTQDGLMSSTDKNNLDTLNALLGEDSDNVINKIDEVFKVFDSYPEGDKIVDALADKQDKVTKKGSTTKPVYVSSDGTFEEASTYAGGTKVNLNGSNKGGSNAIFYAPLSAGSDNQILKSNGTGSPTWINPSELSVGSATKATNDANGSAIHETYAPKTDIDNLQRDIDDVSIGVEELQEQVNTLEENYTTDMSNKQDVVEAQGSSIRPVFVTAKGEFTTTWTYAGGTKVNLNGEDKGALDADIYAPSEAGVKDQVLVSKGSGSPEWTNQNNLSVNSATKATNDANGNPIHTTYALKSELQNLIEIPIQENYNANGNTYTTTFDATTITSANFKNHIVRFTTYNGNVSFLRPESLTITTPEYKFNFENTLLGITITHTVATGTITINKYSMLATELSHGLMSANDKKILDGIDDTYAKKAYGVYYVEGNKEGTAGVWTGTNSDITSLYDGLVVNYKIGIDGGSSSTTLKINTFDAKPCYLKATTSGNTALTTQYAIGTMVLLSYNATTGAFYSSDYDTNTNTYQKLYPTTTDEEYAITARYKTNEVTSSSSEYGRFTPGITLNPAKNSITATTFKGNLEGTANKATYDGDGNLIVSTYIKKSDIKDSVLHFTTSNSTVNKDIEAVILFAFKKIYSREIEADQSFSITLNPGFSGGRIIFYGGCIRNGNATSSTTEFKVVLLKLSDTYNLMESYSSSYNYGDIPSLTLDNITYTIKTFATTAEIENKVDKTTTVNGKALSSNIELSKSDIGLGNVDNTSDLNKPISTATQTALDLKENKANLKALAYKDSLTKSDVGLSNVNNVAITQDEVTQITTNKNNINTYKNQMNGLEDRVTLLEEGGVDTSGLVSKFDIVDNLNSTATDKPLSAYQGKLLGERVTNLENSGGGSGGATNTNRTYTKQLYGSDWLRIAKVDDVAKNSSGIFTVNLYGIDNLGVKSILTTSVFSVSCGLASDGTFVTDVFPITQTPEVQTTGDSGSGSSSDAGGSAGGSGASITTYGLSNIRLEYVPYENSIYALGLFSFPAVGILYTSVEVEMKIENNLNFGYLEDIYVKEIEDENAVVEGMELEDDITYVTTFENTIDNILNIRSSGSLRVKSNDGVIRTLITYIYKGSSTALTVYANGGGQYNIAVFGTLLTKDLNFLGTNNSVLLDTVKNSLFADQYPKYIEITKLYITPVNADGYSIYVNDVLVTDYSSIEISSNSDVLKIVGSEGQAPDLLFFNILGSTVVKIFGDFTKIWFGSSSTSIVEVNSSLPETFIFRIGKEVSSNYSDSYKLYSPNNQIDKIGEVNGTAKTALQTAQYAREATKYRLAYKKVEPYDYIDFDANGDTFQNAIYYILKNDFKGGTQENSTFYQFDTGIHGFVRWSGGGSENIVSLGYLYMYVYNDDLNTNLKKILVTSSGLPSTDITTFTPADIEYTIEDYVTAPQDLRSKTLNPTVITDDSDPYHVFTNITFDDMDYSNKKVTYDLNSVSTSASIFELYFPNKIINSKVLITADFNALAVDENTNPHINFRFSNGYLKLGYDVADANDDNCFLDSMSRYDEEDTYVTYDCNNQMQGVWIFEIVFDSFGDITLTPTYSWREI